jgi:hypothetical protein
MTMTIGNRIANGLFRLSMIALGGYPTLIGFAFWHEKLVIFLNG